jgi:curved DNA-binding protein CbpA
MEGKNYYQTLGVPTDADLGTIKTMYRRLERKYHPDLNPGDKFAESKFKEAAEAYEVLRDPVKRAEYNQGMVIDEPMRKIAGQRDTYRNQRPFGWKKKFYHEQPVILDEVDNHIGRIKSSIGFAKQMWGNGEELGQKLYHDILDVNIGRFEESLNNGKYPEAGLYIEAIDRIGKESGMDAGFMGKILKEMKAKISDER